MWADQQTGIRRAALRSIALDDAVQPSARGESEDRCPVCPLRRAEPDGHGPERLHGEYAREIPERGHRAGRTGILEGHRHVLAHDLVELDLLHVIDRVEQGPRGDDDPHGQGHSHDREQSLDRPPLDIAGDDMRSR
jgi:hypothetical protein